MIRGFIFDNGMGTDNHDNASNDDDASNNDDDVEMFSSSENEDDVTDSDTEDESDLDWQPRTPIGVQQPRTLIQRNISPIQRLSY